MATFSAGSGAAGSSSALPSIAIVDANVVHPERDVDDAIARHSTVVITGSRIAEIGPSASTPIPQGAQIVQGTGKCLIPGLVDGHVHFFQSANPYTRPDVIDLTKRVPYANEVARNKARL